MADAETHADAVVAALNDDARNWSIDFDAVRANLPTVDLVVAAAGPIVNVVGMGEAVKRATRGGLLAVVTTVDIGFSKWAANLGAEVDGLKAQTKAIARYFAKLARLPSEPSAVVVRVERRNYFDVDQLDQASLFQSVITLTIEDRESWSA